MDDFGYTNFFTTDQRLFPFIRVLNGLKGSDGAREFFCEVEGAGLGWSDPFWVMEHNGQRTEVTPPTQSILIENDIFLRVTKISFPFWGTSNPKVFCICANDTAGEIQNSVMDSGKL